MIRTVDEIGIGVAPERCYALAADIEHYAKFMPDYRNARVLSREGDSITVEKTARVRGMSFTWTSVGTPRPPNQVHYRWRRGILKGMETTWSVHPDAGGCRLEIVHEIRLPWWRGGDMIARGIVYPFFIRGMAKKTLELFKAELERGDLLDCDRN